MRPMFLLLVILYLCSALSIVNGQVDDLPPPPPPPIPPPMSDIIPPTKDTADVQPVSNDTEAIVDDTAVNPGINENGTSGENITFIDLPTDPQDLQNATLTVQDNVGNGTSNETNLNNQTITSPEQLNDTITSDSNVTNVLSDILNEIRISTNDSLTQAGEINDTLSGLSNDTVASNDTSIDTTGIEMAMNKSAREDTASVSSPDIGGFKVDLPPPPPIIGVPPENEPTKTETGIPTVNRIDTNVTEADLSNDTILQVATDDNTTREDATTPAATNVSDMAAPPPISDSIESSVPALIAGSKMTGGSVSGLPPPIIIPDVPQVPSSQNQIKKTNFIENDRIKDTQRTIVTARPPPPPIIFKEDIVPTSWIDPRLKQTTSAPVPPTTMRTKDIPSESDPKYMSVSELAYYTLNEMKRQKEEREMKAKGMGVQVFFNTLQPIEKPTPITDHPSNIRAMVGDRTTAKYQTQTPIQTTKSPILPTQPIDSPPPDSARKFYGADFLLSQLGIGIQTTTPEPTTTKTPVVKKATPNIPRGLFKPFLPIIHDTRMSPPLRPATRAPISSSEWRTERPVLQNTEAPNQMLFDSNFLLQQLGLNDRQSHQQREPITRSPVFWQNTQAPRSATTVSPLFWQNQQTPRPQTTRSPFSWQPTHSPNTFTTNAPVFRNPFNPLLMRTQSPGKNIFTRTTQKPRIVQPFIQPHFGMRNVPTSMDGSLQQNIINPVQFQTDNRIRNQRRGQFHTRPIDLTKPKPQHNIDLNKQNIVKSTNEGTKQLNMPTKTVPLTNVNFPRQSSIRGLLPFVFGAGPVEKDTPFWQKTKANTNKNTGMRLRQKFNQRLQQNSEKDTDAMWNNNLNPSSSLMTNSQSNRDLNIALHAFNAAQPRQENTFNFQQNQDRKMNVFNLGDRMVNIGRRIQSFPHEIEMPQTGSEVRRNFNQHLNEETIQPYLPSDIQQPHRLNVDNLNLNIKPQTKLADQHGESQISQSRTFDLQNNPFHSHKIQTNIKPVSGFTSSQKIKIGTQTHWSAQPANSWRHAAAHVPYKLDHVHLKKQPIATKSAHDYIPQTPITSNVPNKLAHATPRIQELHRPITTAQTTTLPTTTTTMTTTTTTTTTTTILPTVPPTADPNPPPIFDTKILQTFMPMPKPGDTTPPTDFGGGNGNNQTQSNTEGSCTGCVFVNDRCLLPHPQHCNMYIECVRQNRQERSFTRECALGAFFDRKSFLCVDPRIADCPTDRCREPGLKWYPIEGHCKHYWSCGLREGGSAFAQSECCPDMGGFLDGQGCVENPNCTESCDQTINRNAPTGCKLKKTASSTVYYDENAKMERPCAPGTLFNELQCTCVQDVTLERRENRTGGENCTCSNDTACACRDPTQAATGEPNCPASLVLTFDKEPISDMSSTKQNIGIDGVGTTKAGEGIFNGGSKLVLWRYANLRIPLVFAVRIKFLVTSSEPRIQTLMSNCDKTGAIQPTFDLSIDTLYGEVIFTVNTYDGQAKKFKIMYEANKWSSIDVIYDGERVVGSVNGRPRNIISAGGIETRPFPLSIGGCNANDGFKGLMENVYIYEKCIPDEMYGIFMAVLE